MIVRAGFLLAFIFMSLGQVVAEFPTAHDANSTYFIEYDDLDRILKGSVLEMGASTHRPPKQRLTKITGTRIQIGNILKTRQEGNRLMFHEFEERERQVLRNLCDELLSIPSQISFSALSRNEQLGYWLNLHNVIVLAEISEEYPVTRLKPFFDENDPSSFLNQRRFEMNGTMISLADIERHVTANWRDPVVIYGFYFAAVGTPNLRTAAYRGGKVYDQLRSNAVDFVNSMRGTQIWQGPVLKVSTYYKRMAIMFPDFEINVRDHIEKYAKPDFKRRMITTNSISAEIKDWHIADLYNGKPGLQPGGQYPRLTKDGNWNMFTQGSPEHVTQLLRDRQLKFLRRNGTVDIEELPQNKDAELREEEDIN